MQTIPGVSLTIYKQDRQLTPDDDGYLGKLYSGYVVLEARVAAGGPVIGLQQQSRDRYSPARDWMQLAHVSPNPSPLIARRFWYQQGPAWYAAVGRMLPAGMKVYRHKVALDANQANANSFVPYPNNLLALARYEHNGQGFTNRVSLWKYALISQHDDQYFVSVQKMYETTAHQNGKRACFPRFTQHPTLEMILVDNLPDGIHLTPVSEYRDEEGPALKHLRYNEGIVINWYEARGVGMVLTKQGEARVVWRDIPGRPRKSFLIPGEVVTIERLGPPTAGEKTRFRPQPRKSNIALQAYGVTPKNGNTDR